MASRFHLGTQSGGLLLKLEPPPHPGAIGATHHRDHLTVASERNVGTLLDPIEDRGKGGSSFGDRPI